MIEESTNYISLVLQQVVVSVVSDVSCFLVLFTRSLSVRRNINEFPFHCRLSRGH